MVEITIYGVDNMRDINNNTIQSLACQITLKIVQTPGVPLDYISITKGMTVSLFANVSPLGTYPDVIFKEGSNILGVSSVSPATGLAVMDLDTSNLSGGQHLIVSQVGADAMCVSNMVLVDVKGGEGGTILIGLFLVGLGILAGMGIKSSVKSK